MLHLAQVQTKDSLGKAKLQLLAQQQSEYTWALHATDDQIVLAEVGSYSEGALVLVELSDETGQVQQLQDAKDWVLALVEQYLTCGITPLDLQQEEQRAEQWRQSLTLQSQELGRRALEMEARRDQIQELEENLKQEKKQLETRAAELEIQAAELRANLGQTNLGNAG
jgi:chromosome segregation ATPase